MVSKSVTARHWSMLAALRLRDAACRFRSDVRLLSGGKVVSAKDLTDVLLFEPGEKCRVTLVVTGADEKRALAELTPLLLEATRPPDFNAAFFRAAAALELVPEAERRQDWLRVRRRLAEPDRLRLMERIRRWEASGRLRLSDRKDILLLLLYVRGRLGRLAEGICGTTRILKLLFIADQELDTGSLVRNPYRFQPYRFGPFTGAVYDDLAVLIDAGLVRREHLDEEGTPVIQCNAELDEGFASNGLTTLYRLTHKGREFARTLLEEVRSRRPNLEPGLEIVKRQFGALPLKELLRYIYTRYPEFTTESEILKRVLGKRG
ncbi:MAG: HPr family phosphocarrier protein [candidate division WOR-3 bacterium]